MKLSSVREGEIVRMKGSTSVLFESGQEWKYVWDVENPEVDVIGRGHVERTAKIIWES